MIKRQLIISAVFICLVFAGTVLAAAQGVEWTGTEWNGDIDGKEGERNCDIVQIGREPARTDSIPYETKEQALISAIEYAKELSPYYVLLSGTDWKFSFYENPSLAETSEDADFYKVDFDASDWESIYVPSVWQTEGYDHPIYTNTTQKFARNFGNDDIGYPRDLPAAPTVYNPVGLYRHTFAIPSEWEGQRVYIDLEGVDSAFYIWINGIQAGYAEDSFTTNEFDITDYVNFGEENVIAVKAYRWCDGSWIEDQDYFDLSGIFRDVYCYAAPQVRVRDFGVITDFDSTFTDSTLEVEVMVRNYLNEQADSRVILHLFDADGNEVGLNKNDITLQIAAGEEERMYFAIPVEAPEKWSAEDPYLYTLVLEEISDAGTVYESAQVGFRKITYKSTESGWFEGATDDQDLICINGKPICFRGVDRHETDPEKGYALTRERMEEDIRIMLENNINSVRTSHYPNSNYWYYLCDKYGIYVVDEANLECHSNMITENERITEYLSAAIIDREYNMVRRDRNHASIVMWSLGNECKNPEILRTILVQPYEDPEGTERVLHEYTKDRPWHYEQAKEMYETGIDVFSGMYEKVEALTEHGISDVPAPMIECEYEHAMGNSEGNFDEYWEAFDTYRNLQGGFIWDYVDQSIYAYTEDGTQYFGYGGDFGEHIQDDNFCANGLLLPDRTVQPEMAEVKYHYQQVKFEDVDSSSGQVMVKNFFLFTDIADKYEMAWTLTRNDEVLRSGIVDSELLHIPCVDAVTNQPGTKVISIDPGWCAEDVKPGSEYFLNLSVKLKEDEGLLSAGHEIAREQYQVYPPENILKSADDIEAETNSDGSGPLRWSDDGEIIAAAAEKLKVRISRESGRIVECQGIAPDGSWKDLLSPGEGPEGEFVRGATDNDRGFGNGFTIHLDIWEKKGEYLVENVDVNETSGEYLRVKVSGSYPDLNGLEMNISYTIYKEGFILVQTDIIPHYDSKNYLYLPTAGMSMTVPAGYEQITWFGYGPEETYIDRYKGTSISVWKTTVTDNFFPYIQASETGNHIGTRWLTLTDSDGFGLMAASVGEYFEFSALHYTTEELDRGVHPYELNAISDTILKINAKQTGVGGDDAWSRIAAHEEYRLDEEIYSYGYILGAVNADTDITELAYRWQQICK